MYGSPSSRLFPLLIVLNLSLPAHMALHTVRHPAAMMCTLPFIEQMPHGFVVEQCGSSDNVRPKLMAGAARTGSGRSKDELPVRIEHGVGCDLGQRPTMFRMAGQACFPLDDHLAVKVAHGRFGANGKPFFRMTG